MKHDCGVHFGSQVGGASGCAARRIIQEDLRDLRTGDRVRVDGDRILRI